MTNDLLTIHDVANLLAVHYNTARALVRDRIPHVNVGTGRRCEHLRVRRSDFDAWMRENTRNAVARASDGQPLVNPDW